MQLWDWVIIAAYGLLVLVIGWRTGRDHQTSRDLFLGGKRIPTWAAFLSMVSTELSAATFIGVPQAGYAGNWRYLQLAFGNLAAKWVLSVTFLRRYHELELVTVYGFLAKRFSDGARRLAAAYFLGGRVVASGVRLFIGGLAFAAATGVSVEWAIVLAGTVGLVYTLFGGIRAVIWTDTLQGSLFIIAAASSLIFFAFRLDGGLGGMLEAGQAAGKTTTWILPPLLAEGTSADTVWGWVAEAWRGFVEGYLKTDTALPVGVIFAFLLTLATHGTDQDMVQRLLTTSDAKKGGRALIGSGLANFPLTLLFLAIGTGLWAFYEGGLGRPTSSVAVPGDQVFPFFVLHEMPTGLRGLIFAGLFAAAMSSLDSALNALATTWVVDIRQLPEGDKRTVVATRVATLAFGVLLIGAAIGLVGYRRALDAAQGDAPRVSLVVFALRSMVILYGALLGVFLVGMFSERRGTGRSAVAGLLAGGAVGLVLFLQPYWTPWFSADGRSSEWIPGFWHIVLSAGVTILVTAAARRSPSHAT